jgi:hypothetical protein
MVPDVYVHTWRGNKVVSQLGFWCGGNHAEEDLVVSGWKPGWKPGWGKLKPGAGWGQW